jgi:hypothetical protein
MKILRGFWEKGRGYARRLGIAVQHVIVTLLLFLVYIIGFGLTRLLMIFIGRERFRQYHLKSSDRTFWFDATGYEQQEKNFIRQF